jgi:hypothetical protein
VPWTRRLARDVYKVTRVGREGTKVEGKTSTFVTSNFKDAVRVGTEWQLAKDEKGNRLWHVTTEGPAGVEEK